MASDPNYGARSRQDYQGGSGKVISGVAGKSIIILGGSISSDSNSRIILYSGSTSGQTKNIAGGYFGANGQGAQSLNPDKFGYACDQGEDLNVFVSAGNAQIFLEYVIV